MVALLLAGCSTSRAPVLPKPTFEDARREMLMGEWLKAAHLFERIAEQPASAREKWEAQAWSGVCRLKLGQADEVIPALQKLSSECRDPEVLVRIREALAEGHRMRGEYRAALRAWSEIRAMSSDVVGAVIKADELLYQLGCACLRAGESEAGVGALKEMLLKYSTSLRAGAAALRAGFGGCGVKVPGPVQGLKIQSVKVELRGKVVDTASVVACKTFEEALQLGDRLGRTGLKVEVLP